MLIVMIAQETLFNDDGTERDDKDVEEKSTKA